MKFDSNKLSYLEYAERLLKRNPINKNGFYKRKIIREYLIYTFYRDSQKKLNAFFESHLTDEKLLIVLLDILLDDEVECGSDAQMGAAYYIGKFSKNLLVKHKKQIERAQKYAVYALRPFPNELPAWF